MLLIGRKTIAFRRASGTIVELIPHMTDGGRSRLTISGIIKTCTTTRDIDSYCQHDAPLFSVMRSGKHNFGVQRRKLRRTI